MIKRSIASLALLFLCSTAFAQGPAGAGTKSNDAPKVTAAKRPKKQFIIGAITASAACGVSIGFSSNPALAAGVGIPVLIGGQYFAHRLYQNHPKWSAFVQLLSPLACFSGGFHHAPLKKPAKITKPQPPSTPQPPTPPTPPGNPPPGPGGNPGGNPPPGPGGNPGGNPPPGPGGNPGGNPPPGPGGNPPPGGGSGCIQDCGFPGNGGVNGGRDIKKPPFPGKGHVPGGQS